ncbi:CD166 antigen homolog A isoform X2 [Alosa alosa]|uniref:CD166 antigen homolog A isoform X2 n=1 Tax=Alosa alosa TaxID=278164 RepID=UPI002015415A|nr:CD166 antigen homolog A isoform X2 [Alosa alosa]
MVSGYQSAFPKGIEFFGLSHVVIYLQQVCFTRPDEGWTMGGEFVQYPRAHSSIPTIVGLYGETIEVPCINGGAQPDGLMFTKWKYMKDDNTAGDLLVKQAHKEEATIQASDGYRDRVSIAPNSSLLIAKGTLEDQRLFTCMQVWGGNVKEYPVQVSVHKRPSPPQIKDKAKELENGKLTTLGTCIASDANPVAILTWTKDGQPLVPDDKTIKITGQVTKDPSTGLSKASSLLQYTAGKEDVGSQFTCVATHPLVDQESAPETFTVHYPTEKVNLQVINKGAIKEGDDVTLKCQADGNPPPTSFNFYLKDQKVPVMDNDTYTLRGVTRESSGEYKCSLLDDKKKQDTQEIIVHYLDLSVSPSGRVLKNFGDTLVVMVDQNASVDAQISWTKDNEKLEKEPVFGELTYADAGLYVLEVSVAGIKKSHSFELDVQGKPSIKFLTEKLSSDGNSKVLICVAEGSPEPNVQWSVNGTNEKTSYSSGKVTHEITVVPSKNLTVHCTVSNSLGEDSRDIFLQSDTSTGNDQAKLIVGIVVGLILAAAIVGLIYWLYMKNSRQGSWKTREKEMGTSEEEKKLEENNHKPDV